MSECLFRDLLWTSADRALIPDVCASLPSYVAPGESKSATAGCDLCDVSSNRTVSGGVYCHCAEDFEVVVVRSWSVSDYSVYVVKTGCPKSSVTDLDCPVVDLVKITVMSVIPSE